MVRDGRSKMTFDDKVAQQVMAIVLEAVYEQDFLPCSYGSGQGGRRIRR
jgi:retron-type reverse transcriptase